VLGDYLASISDKLKPFSDTPSMDASVLLAGLLGKPRAWVIAHPEASLISAERAVLENALKRLEGGEPLPYILGHWEFYGLDFLLNPATLIPRPETELLVEQALEWLKDHPDRRRIADVGTGSGCIAISLACHLPDLQIIATDISGLALQAALANARRHGVSGPITFIQGNLLDGVAAQFDLICANLPYIPAETLRSLPVYNREPDLALDGGADGLDLIQELLRMAPQRLAQGGRLLMEIEASQASIVSFLAREVFAEQGVSVLKDSAGKERLLVVDKSSVADKAR
jgi:release factor glutamine methyltransferase